MTMAEPNSQEDSTTPRPGFFRRVESSASGFWERVTSGLEMEALWRQFVSEAREGYDLYSKEVDWDAAKDQKSRYKWTTHVFKAFFWSLILKLSPPRRVVLLIGIVLVALPAVSDRDPVFAQLGGAILFVLLALELADRVVMKRDLQITREIQGWLVPAQPPIVAGAELAFASRPANTVSGDYYDAFWRGEAPVVEGSPDAAVVSTASPTAHAESKMLIVVADVAGKSVPAALLMATLQASLHSLAEVPSTLAELAMRLNAYACAHSALGRRFTTAFLAELDPANRVIGYVNAGHNAPILRRVSGAIERLDQGGVPLGVVPGTVYEAVTVQLAPGDTLLIFTDGLIEALNEKGEEFTEPRLLNIVRSFQPSSAAQLRDRALAEVLNYIGTARQHDDITCLILFIPASK
jgi:phosphoserine phosphatase RsbU/P